MKVRDGIPRLSSKCSYEQTGVMAVTMVGRQIARWFLASGYSIRILLDDPGIPHYPYSHSFVQRTNFQVILPVSPLVEYKLYMSHLQFLNFDLLCALTTCPLRGQVALLRCGIR